MTHNKILYKYRFDNDYTEKIFMNKKIWLPSAQTLNDVFECEMQPVREAFYKKVLEFHQQNLIAPLVVGILRATKGGGKHFMGCPIKEANRFLKEIQNAGNLDNAEKMVRNFVYKYTKTKLTDIRDLLDNLQAQIKKTGIFSLTEDCCNELMWAHYGDSSKGIALGFESIPGSKLADSQKCVKVEYSDEMPSFSDLNFEINTQINFGKENRTKLSFNDPSFKRIISNKTTNWAYEKEWRYVEEAEGEYEFPGPLVEIVFGCRCLPQVRKKYIDYVQNLGLIDVKFFEIKLAKDVKKMEKAILDI